MSELIQLQTERLGVLTWVTLILLLNLIVQSTRLQFKMIMNKAYSQYNIREVQVSNRIAFESALYQHL